MVTLHKKAYQFQQMLAEEGYENEVVQLPGSTRTAQEAAEAIGCHVSQIAKSILFRLEPSGHPLLVIASGRNRIDEHKVAQDVGETLGKADPDYVRKQTGYTIGGVPPLGHPEPIQTFIDEDIFQFQHIWAAAGHGQAVMKLTPEELLRMTNGRVVTIIAA